MQRYKPVVLIILDGFGVSPDKIGSPWEEAKHPTFSEIEKFFPFTALQASGMAVGLPWGEEGNSEVGHLAIGAGKIVYNHLPQISTAISDGTFATNSAFVKAINHTTQNNSSLHIMGLYSSGTVHAYDEHLHALLDLTKQNKVREVFLHLFTDGKDAYEKEGASFYKKLEEKLRDYPNVKIASIIGRKFAMDRDGNWDKTQKAYDLFVNGVENEFDSASDYIKKQYQENIFDASIEPGLVNESSEQNSRIKDGDAVIIFNFREDSPRQLVRAFVDEDFDHFERKKINNLLFVTMTDYDKNLSSLPAFEMTSVEHPLARTISETGLSQIHIAESEKYAHITYFLNGGKEKPFEGEERILVPSPSVPSYDQVPEMSADKIVNLILENLEKYDFVVANFANADMVGHTGNFEATSRAFEKIDESIGKIFPKILDLGGALAITADHGNAEEKRYKLTGEKRTKHSINPVPFYLVGEKFKKEIQATQDEINAQYKDTKGALADVAPTILELLNIKQPVEMTGKSLVGKLSEKIT